MSLGAKAAPAWDQWEGQIVDRKFRLLRFLGRGERSAVFLTERPQGEPSKAAIKLVPADGTRGEAQLARWAGLPALSHPHLLRLFETGRGHLGGISFAYVLMEYAEEDLSQVDRPLTAVEALDMLGGTLEALAYLHGRGLVHGHLQPSNIMAVSDQLKISSDAVRLTGKWRADLDLRPKYDPPEIAAEGASAAADMWSLGITLVEAVTKRRPSWEPGTTVVSLPDDLPRQFQIPVANCLRHVPRQRWTAADFEKALEQHAETSLPPERRSPDTKGARRYLVPVGAVALALAGVAIIPRLISDRPSPPSRPTEPASLPREPVTIPPPVPDAPRKAEKTEVREPSGKAALQGVVKQVLPDVPARARSSIRGTVTVNIRVTVDGAGSVVDAQDESPNSSRFFSNLALEAARGWKFAPAGPGRSANSREWILRFRFVRDAKRPVSVQATSAR